jgi:Fe-S-cluster containining protein
MTFYIIRYGEFDLNLNNKLTVLDKVYKIYDQFMEAYKNVCKRYCADCCTCNLTVTTLEAYHFVENLNSDNKIKILNRLANSPQQRFRPTLTFNRIAALYAQGKDVPEEQNNPSWGKCPFLEKLECGYYQFRPFGCRCMVSKKCCSENGYAEMDPMVMTVNDVFMQFIEHLDTGGFSGNFTDVLNLLTDEKNRELYKQNELQGEYSHLISNMPITVLLVPPEHRKKIEPFLYVLNNLLDNKD